MIFKRLLITAVALFIGLSLGLLIAPGFIQRFGLPNTTGGICIVAIPCAVLVAAICHLVYKRITDDMGHLDEVEQQQMKRRWAWLKPAGLALRSPFPLNKNQVIIGRDIKCDVMILNDSISRKHAEIVREGAGWRIRDLGSSNGTFINGQRKDDALLNEGDLITLGDINLTFEGPHEPLPETLDGEEGMPFGSDPEAVMPFDPQTQLAGYGTAGTGTQAYPGTGTQAYPCPGTGTQAYPGTGTQACPYPGTGTQSYPYPGTGPQAYPGTGTQSYPYSGTGTQSYPGRTPRPNSNNSYPYPGANTEAITPGTKVC